MDFLIGTKCSSLQIPLLFFCIKLLISYRNYGMQLFMLLEKLRRLNNLLSSFIRVTLEKLEKFVEKLINIKIISLY